MSSGRNIKNVLGLLEPYDPGLFPGDIKRKYGIPEEEIVNLSSNENPYPPPERLIKKITDELGITNRYPDPSYKELKQSISEYVGLPTENVAVGNGSSDLIELACKIILGPLDRVVMPIPTYALYMLTSMIWETGITYVGTEEAAFRLTANRVRPFLEDAKLVFLGSPNNPTGLSIEIEEIKGMLSHAETTFVLDEAYSEFSGKTAAGLLEDNNNLIIMRSMSKHFCLAGLRVGYALSDPTTVESLEKVRLPFTINNLANRAAIEALKERDYFNRKRQEIVSERERVRENLENIGLKPFPSDANFLMVKLPQGSDSDEFTAQLASQGVIVRSLKGLLGLSGDYFRVTVGTIQENEKFIRTCENILSRKP